MAGSKGAIKRKLKRVLPWLIAMIIALIAGFSVNCIIGSNARKDLEDSKIEFTVTDAQGEEFSLSDFRGKPVVVNFWAIWCPPCKAELPAMQKAYEEYKGEVEFLFVNLLNWRGDTVEEVQTFMKDGKYSFPVYYDEENSAERACTITSIPLTLFIDKNGNVEETYNSAISEMLLRSYIEKIID